MKQFIKFIFQKSTIYPALKTSILVGSVLNMINQGEVIIDQGLAALAWGKILLTFLVPYLVSTYATTQAKLSFEKRNNHI